jgi:hypothetical protein
MTAFQRVDGRHAGPGALGILVPPGLRTFVILRPRALEWDLLPLRPGLEQAQPAVFCTFGRDEAVGLARRIQQALESGVAKAPHPVEVVVAAPETSFGIGARVEAYLWIVCQRLAGQPYQPCLFASVEEADTAAARLVPYLWPALGARQEYYFNTQAFSG